MNVTIVIPTYNENENIEKLVHKIFASIKGYEVKVFVVDDNSPDGTANTAEHLGRKYPISVIRRSGKMGLGSAYIEGFSQALAENPDVIVQMDADLSHDPAVIPRFLQTIQGGADVVIGSRRVPGGSISNWSSLRNWESKSAMWFARLLLHLHTHDVTSGFRCFRRKVLGSIDFLKVKSSGYSFQEEMIFLIERAQWKVQEIPITFHERQNGRSKLSRHEVLSFFLKMFELRLEGKKVFTRIKKS